MGLKISMCDRGFNRSLTMLCCFLIVSQICNKIIISIIIINNSDNKLMQIKG